MQALHAVIVMRAWHPRRHAGAALAPPPVSVPVRDLLLCWFWCCSFFSSRVDWRGNEFEVDADGVMRRLT